MMMGVRRLDPALTWDRTIELGANMSDLWTERSAGDLRPGDFVMDRGVDDDLWSLRKVADVEPFDTAIGASRRVRVRFDQDCFRVMLASDPIEAVAMPSADDIAAGNADLRRMLAAAFSRPAA